MIVLTVFFGGSRRARGVGHGQCQVGVVLEQTIDQAGFSTTGWRGNDEKVTALTRHFVPVPAFALLTLSSQRKLELFVDQLISS